MTRLSKSQHRHTLIAANNLLTELIQHIGLAIDTLDECQPGYPTGGNDGPSGRGGHSDRTGDLATRTHPDIARQARDALDHLTNRITNDIRDLDALTRRWTPPSSKWRDALATEAATTHEDTWCTSCIRVGSLTPTRTPGSRLCRWCEDMTRELTNTPPEWLVEKRRQGGRINSIDIAKAKRDARTTKKAKR